MRLGKRRDGLAPHGEVSRAQGLRKAAHSDRARFGLMLGEPAIDELRGGQSFGHKILGQYSQYR